MRTVSMKGAIDKIKDNVEISADAIYTDDSPLYELLPVASRITGTTPLTTLLKSAYVERFTREQSTVIGVC